MPCRLLRYSLVLYREQRVRFLCGSIWTCPLWVTCGRRPGKNFLTFLQHWLGAVTCRPVDAARVAAGPNALRGSGPNRKHAFKDAMTQAGSPDPRNDRICITSSCPRQLVLPIYPLASVMPPSTASAPCICLRYIETNRANLAHGRLPSMWLLQRNHPLAHRCRRVGAVHSIMNRHDVDVPGCTLCP
jgi:hypothetical protein